MGYLRLSLLSPLSSDTQSYTIFLQLKSTDKTARNLTYKVKRYFPQHVEGARDTILFYFYEN